MNHLTLFLPALVLSTPFLFARWRFAWRSAWVYALVLGAIWRLSPPVHWSDEDWAYGLVMAAIGYNILFAAACFTLRSVYESLPYRCNARTRVGPGMTKPDLVLIAATAGLTALFAFIGLSWITAGSNAAFVIHAGLVCLAAVIFIYAKRQAGAIRQFFLGFSIALGLVTVASGVLYPIAVLDAAQRVSRGAPYCIALHLRKRAAQSRGDLTFLTLDKHQWQRHASLHIATDGRVEVFNYSYYRTRFLPHPGWPTPIPCDPSMRPLRY